MRINMYFSRKLIAIFALSLPTFAAVPTVTGQSASSITHASVHLTATVSPASSYVQWFLGTTSGVYTAAASESYKADDYGVGGFVKVSFGNLKPSTQYYACLKARPNQDTDTDITSCATSGYEITFTTSADVTHPVVPDSPDEYNPALPDLAGYTPVPMECSGSPQTWRAASNVPNPGDWTSSVSAGDILQTVVQKVYFGTTIDLPANTRCKLPATGYIGTGSGTISGVGVYYPYKTVEGVGITSPSHRWIVIRTVGSSTLFPPDGVQIDPTWTAPAVIESNGSTADQWNTTYGSGGANVARNTAQCIMDDHSVTAGTAPTHHYMFYRVVCEADSALSGTELAGDMVQIGGAASSNIASNPPDYIILEQVIIRGAQNAYTLEGFSKLGKRVILRNSYIDRVKYLGTVEAAAVKVNDGDQGQLTLHNNFIRNENGFGIYAEANAGSVYQVAKDTVIRRTRLYMPVLDPATHTDYRTRQPIEFKRGNRILIEGNIIDGSRGDYNEAAMVMVSGNSDTDSTAYSGVHNVRVRKNIMRNGQTFVECMGVRPTDNLGPPVNIVNSTVYVDDNWAYNMGVYGHRAGGGGLSGAKIWHGPGCVDFTVKNNTLNRFDNRDTWGGDPGADVAPGLVRMEGGATLAEGFYFQNNVVYPDYGTGAGYFNGRFDVRDAQKIASHPQAPAVNLAGTPTQFLESFSNRVTNGTVTPYYNFDGNVMIPGYKNTGSNTWVEMNSGDLATLQSGMPGTNTWATGNTLAAREANVGFTPATGRCTGCSGAGADIDAIYSAAGIVTNIAAPTPGSTSLAFSYTAPDSDACYVEASADSWVTVARASDGGGSTSRTPTLSGLSPSTLYDWRILCEFRQVNSGIGALSEAWPSDQVSEGSTTTGATAGVTKTIGGGMTIGGGVTF
jgi:hypothetical protein